jgi:hypothetical protein
VVAWSLRRLDAAWLLVHLDGIVVHTMQATEDAVLSPLAISRKYVSRTRAAGQEIGILWVITAARRTASVAQAALIRDVFGDPFHPVPLDLAWLAWHGGLLVSMTQRMYGTRDFSDMPVLADVMEESGCQDQDILGHCRSGGEHVKGCWLIDLLLGKS